MRVPEPRPRHPPQAVKPRAGFLVWHMTRGLASPRKVPHETQLKPFFAPDETIFRLLL
jgi:hypothetical protein